MKKDIKAVEFLLVSSNGDGDSSDTRSVADPDLLASVVKYRAMYSGLDETRRRAALLQKKANLSQMEIALMQKEVALITNDTTQRPRGEYEVYIFHISHYLY